MRKFIAILIAAFLSSPAWAAYSIVQTIDAGTTTAGTSVTSGSYTLTAGDRLIIITGFYGSTDISSSMSDSLGDTYAKVSSGALPNAGSTGVSYSAWEVRNIASNGSTTITLNLTTSAGNSGFCGYEISGLDASAAVQVIAKQSQTSPGTGTDAIVSGSLTPTSAPAMVFGFSQGSNENQLSSAGTGFTGAQCPNFSVINGTSKTMVENMRITSTSVLTNGATFTAGASGGTATYINYGLIISEASAGPTVKPSQFFLSANPMPRSLTPSRLYNPVSRRALKADISESSVD